MLRACETVFTISRITVQSTRLEMTHLITFSGSSERNNKLNTYKGFFQTLSYFENGGKSYRAWQQGAESVSIEACYAGSTQSGANLRVLNRKRSWVLLSMRLRDKKELIAFGVKKLKSFRCKEK